MQRDQELKLFLSFTRSFWGWPRCKGTGEFKALTREYSYRLMQKSDIASREILAYHWHPNDSELRDPHLHIRSIARVHFPTSRVCVEDFISMLIKYYGVKPRMRKSEWTAIVEKNKNAFEKMALGRFDIHVSDKLPYPRFPARQGFRERTICQRLPAVTASESLRERTACIFALAFRFCLAILLRLNCA